jgi:hypothetical protein
VKRIVFGVVGIVVAGAVIWEAGKYFEQLTRADGAPVATVAAQPVVAPPVVAQPAPKLVEVTPKPEPTNEVAGFQFRKDAITDEVMAYVTAKGEEGGILGEENTNTLGFKCDDGSIDVVYMLETSLPPETGINGDGPTIETYSLFYRFNDEPAKSQMTFPSADHKSASLPKDGFLAATGGTATIRISGADGDKRTTTFNLTGVTDALAKLPCVSSKAE